MVLNQEPKMAIVQIELKTFRQFCSVADAALEEATGVRIWQESLSDTNWGEHLHL